MSLQENTTNLRKILNAVKKLPSAGGVELPTLFAPTIAFDSTTTKLTVTDSYNGSFAVDYDLYANDEFIVTLPSKTATLSDYIEHTETLNLKVVATAEMFNNSGDSNIISWIKYNADGTAGLAYTISSDGTYATCTGIGTATDNEIEIATSVNGIPVTAVTQGAFSQNKNITKLVAGQNMKSIGSQAFMYCSNLKEVLLGSNFIDLSDRAFLSCTSIESVILNTQTRGRYNVFAGCTNLVSAIFSAINNPYYDEFGQGYFSNCPKLRRIDLSAVMYFIPLNAISDISGNNDGLQIKVKPTFIERYKSATNWCDIADKIVTEFTNEL